MSWQEDYREKLTTPEEAVTHIRDNDYVLFSHCISEPRGLVDAMVENGKAYKNVTISHMMSWNKGEYTRPEFKENFRFKGFFCGPGNRAAVRSGDGDFIPVYFSQVPNYIRKGLLKVDVCLVMLSPPDDEGYCCIGVDSAYTYQAVKSAKLVIAQINRNVPIVGGDTMIHVSELDIITEMDTDLYETILQEPGEIEMAIGEHCASLIEDGATLQLGIGNIPDAILARLSDRKHLGIHSEMIADGVIPLIEKGVIDGSNKSINKGKVIVTSLYGTKKLYRFCDKNPMIELRTVDYVNDPMVIAQNSKMVSINSAIQVDLLGQVAADTIGALQYSGVGGQVDFIRGTAMSLDGKGRSIIAMPSCAVKKDGRKISKIAPVLDMYSAVTTNRFDVDTIVTEYGIAELKGKSIHERAKALIGIAHPEFRDWLHEEWECRFKK